MSVAAICAAAQLIFLFILFCLFHTRANFDKARIILRIIFWSYPTCCVASLRGSACWAGGLYFV